MKSIDIRASRDRLKMTQAQLAEALGVGVNTIARWERGELTIEHPRMLALALRALEVSKS